MPLLIALDLLWWPRRNYYFSARIYSINWNVSRYLAYKRIIEYYLYVVYF